MSTTEGIFEIFSHTATVQYRATYCKNAMELVSEIERAHEHKAKENTVCLQSCLRIWRNQEEEVD